MRGKHHSCENFDISHAVGAGKYGSREDIDSSHNVEVEQTYKSFAQQPSKPFLLVLCVLSLSALFQLKMTTKERFSVNEVLSHLFDHERECV